jgi:hypothetical protein
MVFYEKFHIKKNFCLMKIDWLFGLQRKACINSMEKKLSSGDFYFGIYVYYPRSWRRVSSELMRIRMMMTWGCLAWVYWSLLVDFFTETLVNIWSIFQSTIHSKLGQFFHQISCKNLDLLNTQDTPQIKKLQPTRRKKCIPFN